MLTRKKISGITAVCAFAVKIIFALCFADTFFVSYHQVPGLDMQTLLRFSEWGGGENTVFFFTFHRLLIYLQWLLADGSHNVGTIFFVQAAVGIAGSVCIADLVLKFSRHRKLALTAGIFSALYLPLLVYEFSVLQETFAVNFTLFTFWAVINALHKRFDRRSSILLTISAFAALAGRPTGVFFIAVMFIIAGYRMFKRKQFRKTVPCAVSLLILLLAAAAFNKIYGMPFSPFYNVMPYTLEYNAAPDSPEPATVMQACRNALSRVPTLFKHGELPENQNIYFWGEKHIFFSLLFHPVVLIPLAVGGILLLLAAKAWKKQYFWLFIPLLTLALPLCAREAIGRYRLMLVPYFIIIAACAAAVFIRLRSGKQRLIATVAAAAGIAFSLIGGDVPQRIRPSDHSAYAMAAENTPGTPPEQILDFYMLYWQYENHSSIRAYSMMMDKALQYRNIELAFIVSAQAVQAGKIPQDRIHYYLAWCFAMQENPDGVYQQLQLIKNLKALPPDMQQKALMLWNDTTRILNNRQK